MISKKENQEGLAQHDLIIEEAIRRGIQVEDLSNQYGKTANRLLSGSKSFTIVQGIIQEWINKSAVQICDEKYRTKNIFKSLKIPTPISYVFKTPNDLTEIFKKGVIYVCKPSVGTNGIGVQMGISSIKDVASYHKTYGYLNDTHLLEEFIAGYDLRIQVINSKIIAACMRFPAFVIGNGQATLEELISKRRQEIKMQNLANDLIIDKQTKSLLEKQKVLFTDIIPTNKKIQLKKIVNMAQGGHAIDVTDEIDAVYHNWVKAIAGKLNLEYFALDLLTQNHKKFTNKNTSALEINIRAEWMHHTFSERRTHDLAKVILDVLF